MSPIVESVAETFDDPDIFVNESWYKLASDGADAVVADGVLTLTVPEHVEGDDNLGVSVGPGSTQDTPNLIDFDQGDSFIVEITEYLDAPSVMIGIWDDPVSMEAAMMIIRDGDLVCGTGNWERPEKIFDNEIIVGAFDPVDHRWWKMIPFGDSGFTEFYVSSDGISWTSVATLTQSGDLSIGGQIELNAENVYSDGLTYSAGSVSIGAVYAKSVPTFELQALVWDQVGERRWETGIDRGVLYLSDGRAVPWNGLTSVEEAFDRELKQYYIDGKKYLQFIVMGDFGGSIKAFTYPDEFEEVLGTKKYDSGVYIHDQKPSSFNLSYRTKVGNDVDGIDHGYRIHLIWNLLAIPDSIPYSTIDESITPIEFGWTLSASPESVLGHRPTAHVSFLSTDMDPEDLALLENRLYGTESSAPEFPSLSDILSSYAEITITDNGDGTWTATGPLDNISETSGMFTITGVDATYSDSDTYSVSTTGL